MNRSKSLFLLMLLTACGLALLSPAVIAWQTIVRDYPNAGTAHAIALDPAGDVIAAGSIYGASVVKLSRADGSRIWLSSLSSPETPSTPEDVAVDRSGNVFVVGYDLGVKKLSGATGIVIWNGSINLTGNAFVQYLRAVRIDNNGDAVVAGEIGGNFTVVKLSGADGTELWHYQIGSVFHGWANAVAVDSKGDVVAVGSTNNKFTVAKLSGLNGAEVWPHIEIGITPPNNSVFEQAKAVTFDQHGDVIVAGTTLNPVPLLNFESFDFTVAKFEGMTGKLVWNQIIDSSNHGSEEANAVAVDPVGDVVAAGVLENSQFGIMKFSGQRGDRLWESIVKPNNLGGGTADAISVDTTGDAIAAGQQLGGLMIAKVASGNGSLVWYHQDNMQSASQAEDVAVDRDNNVVVAGVFNDPISRFTVIKLQGADGLDYFADANSNKIFEEALVRYTPFLKFTSNENYFTLAVEAITDNPGNKLVRREARGERILAQSPLNSTAKSTPKFPLLCINYLGDLYPDNTPSLEIDALFEAGDHEHDANRLQSDPRYKDRIYGRIYYTVDAAGRKEAWLQYWFFLYYNDYKEPGTGAFTPEPGVGAFTPDQHEGDWEMIQIHVDHNAKPFLAIYAAHEVGSWRPWSIVEKTGPNNETPVVYVARGSHASYFKAGLHTIHKHIEVDGIGVNIPYSFDYADGKVLRPDQQLIIITGNSPSWINWQGRWGSTKPSSIFPGSPRGPKFQGDKWDNPEAFLLKCTLSKP